MSKNPSFLQQILSSTTRDIQRSNGSPLVGKVIHVVYGPFLSDGTVDQYYQNPTDEGKIVFQLVYGSQNRSKQGAGNPTAQPINSSFKNYPVPNEYVLITPGPSEKLNKDREAQGYYYFPPLRVWGASHHNALVDAGDYSEYINSANQSYRTNQPTNLSSGQSTTYPLSPDFPEKEYLKTLRSFIGDVIVEGRWGNSIRFGSTSVNKTNN